MERPEQPQGRQSGADDVAGHGPDLELGERTADVDLRVPAQQAVHDRVATRAAAQAELGDRYPRLGAAQARVAQHLTQRGLSFGTSHERRSYHDRRRSGSGSFSLAMNLRLIQDLV